MWPHIQGHNFATCHGRSQFLVLLHVATWALRNSVSDTSKCHDNNPLNVFINKINAHCMIFWLRVKGYIGHNFFISFCFHLLSPGHTVPIIFANVHDVPHLSWLWLNHQIVVFCSLSLAPYAAHDHQYDWSTIVAWIKHDIGTTDAFAPLSVYFPQP